MRTTAVFWLLSGGFFNVAVMAQSSGKLYGSLDGYRTDYHHIGDNLIVRNRTDLGIYIEGGSYYKVCSIDRSQDDKFKYGYWAVELNDSLFLNGFRQDMGVGYVYAEKIEENLYFLGSLKLRNQQQKKRGENDTEYELNQLLFPKEQAFDRCYYKLNLETGQLMYLRRSDMLELLSSFGDLLQQYASEKFPDHNQTIQKYLEELKVKTRPFQNR
ncbi:MAG: hypothetical protein K9G46_00185 [Flavobacteriales bacterium]|nr:hypothetical protein [Flavobacteriales bacterium]